ncbi:hypothetical protein EPI10_010471 [Gossypium australe]|uniref:Uncharacterized protein n=1 Tax=Gossypium australe TaxID=47621 RepID=A0A5B6W6M4_9ROSI|nr:hypothetical protein EPI10_010471 [Gossypium australe]
MGLSFDKISYLFVPHAANGVAHTLALEGRRISHYGEWVHGLPDSVSLLAIKERLQMNLGGREFECAEMLYPPIQGLGRGYG